MAWAQNTFQLIWDQRSGHFLGKGGFTLPTGYVATIPDLWAGDSFELVIDCYEYYDSASVNAKMEFGTTAATSLYIAYRNVAGSATLVEVGTVTQIAAAGAYCRLTYTVDASDISSDFAGNDCVLLGVTTDTGYQRTWAQNLRVIDNEGDGNGAQSSAAIGYTPAVSGDWGWTTSAPDDIKEALDDLAEKIEDHLDTTVNAGRNGVAGSLNVYPSTTSKGRLSITCTAQTGNTVATLNAAAMGQATTLTLPDIGQSTGNVVLLKASQTTAGELRRADLTEDALQPYGIPVAQIRAADGAALGITETDGDHFLALGTNTIQLQGEEAVSETEESVSYWQFVLPPEYVAAGDVKVRVRCKVDGAGTDNASTVDVEAYEQADGAVGADLCATAAQAFAAKSTWYDKDFTVTASGLVAGDVLNIKLTSSVIESGGAALAFYADPPKMLLDVKG